MMAANSHMYLDEVDFLTGLSLSRLGMHLVTSSMLVSKSVYASLSFLMIRRFLSSLKNVDVF